jgi:hypothetical protein
VPHQTNICRVERQSPHLQNRMTDPGRGRMQVDGSTSLIVDMRRSLRSNRCALSQILRASSLRVYKWFRLRRPNDSNANDVKGYMPFVRVITAGLHIHRRPDPPVSNSSTEEINLTCLAMASISQTTQEDVVQRTRNECHSSMLQKSRRS